MIVLSTSLLSICNTSDSDEVVAVGSNDPIVLDTPSVSITISLSL